MKYSRIRRFMLVIQGFSFSLKIHQMKGFSFLVVCMTVDDELLVPVGLPFELYTGIATVYSNGYMYRCSTGV